MHPAYSVILFTTSSGAGYGLLALSGLAAMSHGQASSIAFGLSAIGIGLALVTIGLLASTFHLGRPERAWRALSQWRSSWLSREGIAALVTYPVVLVFAASWIGLFGTADMARVLGLVLFAAAAVTVYCTGKIYSSLPTIRAWAQPLTVPGYLLFSIATGAPLLMATASAFGRWQMVQAWFAVAALAGAALLKLLYWRAIDRAPRAYTIEQATGLGFIGKVRQWEPPHTGENYVMREMGYSIARKHSERLRLIALALLAAAGLLCLLTLLAPPLFPAVLASLCVLAGALVERWLFFAEAEHMSMLYYGRERA
jgi:sulfite dehydrogenase (quinone) subunit SoeC